MSIVTSIPISDANNSTKPLPSLLRLFPEEKSRFSATFDSALPNVEVKGLAVSDPWLLILGWASKSREGLSRSLHCLCVFARSGVDIPISTFTEFSSLTTKLGVSLTDSLLLVGAAFSSTYLKSMGRQDLQTVLSSLHFRLASHVLHCLRTKYDLQQV